MFSYPFYKNTRLLNSHIRDPDITLKKLYTSISRRPFRVPFLLFLLFRGPVQLQGPDIYQVGPVYNSKVPDIYQVGPV